MLNACEPPNVLVAMAFSSCAGSDPHWGGHSGNGWRPPGGDCDRIKMKEGFCPKKSPIVMKMVTVEPSCELMTGTFATVLILYANPSSTGATGNISGFRSR